MTHDDAVKLAMLGLWVRLPHWHFVYLTSRLTNYKNDNTRRILIIVDEDGKEVPNSRGDRLSKRDRAAKNWEAVSADGS